MNPTKIDETAASKLAELFRTLGDTSRIRILSALVSSEHNVSDLAQYAQLSESATSHHLRHLRQMRLVRTRKQGRYVYYTLDDSHIAAIFQAGLDHISHN